MNTRCTDDLSAKFQFDSSIVPRAEDLFSRATYGPTDGSPDTSYSCLKLSKACYNIDYIFSQHPRYTMDLSTRETIVLGTRERRIKNK